LFHSFESLLLRIWLIENQRAKTILIYNITEKSNVREVGIFENVNRTFSPQDDFAISPYQFIV